MSYGDDDDDEEAVFYTGVYFKTGGQQLIFGSEASGKGYDDDIKMLPALLGYFEIYGCECQVFIWINLNR